ncbi:putative replication protein [Zea mays]|uniref:ATP-dependent DNA helicase n=1 Tax=Zea mays TaxID=4577 RepID=A0A1D6QSE5_MAIZE|nr:putative replication protein [Zea mays]
MRRVMQFCCVLSRFVKSGQATSPYSTFLRRLPLLTDTIANRECVVRLRLLNEHVPTMLARMEPHRLLSDHTSSCLKRRLVYNLCCRGGKIVLEPYKCPPAPLCDLLRFDGDSRARRFLRQIRSYNSLYAFTSLGAIVDRSINNSTAPYAFKINGVIHHRIGSLQPSHGLRPQFAQLYIYDTKHEVQNRLGMFENEPDVHDRPDPEGITDAIGRGLTSADSVGGRVIVPASFTGGRRVYGPPDLFVTFTCNPKWKEIVDVLHFEPGQQACDRSDIVLNADQRLIFEKLTESALSCSSGIFFVCGHGGTASSGVASLLLPKGHTAHSRFKIPFDLDEGGVCGVKRGFGNSLILRMTIGSCILILFCLMKRDIGPTVDVVLWGERATTFLAEQVHRDSGSSPQIIIFVGTLVRSYADNVSLSGGSSCKWYIDAPVPEVNALRTSAETNHHPVIWDQGKAANESTVIAVPEHKKLKDIKYLHPFENKKKEWLVIVKVLKIDSSWWYNACKKCLRTTKPHGDTYKCTNNSCDAPTPRLSMHDTRY